MKALKLLKQHCEFNDPYDCYILLAVSRKKETPHITNSQEIVFKRIIKNPEDIEKKYLDIVSQIKSYKDIEGKKYPFYLYIDLNARNAYKASQLLMNNILYCMNDERSGNDRSMMYKRIDSYFYSALKKSICKTKSQKYFMIDYDDDIKKIHKFTDILDKHNIKIVAKHPTKNGYHIKTKPFNREELLKDLKNWDAEIQTDHNLFIEYFK